MGKGWRSVNSELVNTLAIMWAKNERGLDVVKNGSRTSQDVPPLWGYHYRKWFTNFNITLEESPTFARGGGLVDVTVFKMIDDVDYDELTPIEDVTAW